MADTIIAAKAGFFDAVSDDRTYSADDMNMPYKKVISNGVFATQQGTPSTDLQVLTAGNGMGIIVSAGNAIIGNKWFELSSAQSITVANNAAIVPRIDSVIAQMDTRQAGRAGNIVYRTGAAASTPTAPAINQTSGVYELRLANIYVAAGATSILQSNITDMRGSADCPWVTSLINQVDTSVLFDQWAAAYRDLYASADAAITAYMTQAEADWDAFFENLTQDITAVANVLTLQNTVTATAGQTAFSIGIASYDSSTDVLMVFINGLMARASMYSVNGSTVTLSNALAAGDTVTFVVFKSLVTSDLTTVQGLISALDAKVDSVVADTGWQVVATGSSFTGTVKYRKYGKIVFVVGEVECQLPSADESFAIICELPYGASLTHDFVGYEMYSDSAVAVGMRAYQNGDIGLYAGYQTYTPIEFSTSFITDD